MGVNCDSIEAKYTFCILVNCYFLLSIKYSLYCPHNSLHAVLPPVFFLLICQFLQITVISVLMFMVVDMSTCTLHIEFRQTPENQTQNNPALRVMLPGCESTICDVKAESKGQIFLQNV